VAHVQADALLEQLHLVIHITKLTQMHVFHAEQPIILHMFRQSRKEFVIDAEKSLYFVMMTSRKQ
jgi:hypothetical protein